MASFESLERYTGYLLKDSDSTEIIAAIHAIFRGESLIHPSVASKILTEFSLLAEGKGKKNSLLHNTRVRCMDVGCDAFPVSATILHSKRSV